MSIIIRNSSNLPIYEQIKEQIKKSILSDEMNEGDMLPSIRQLARDLKISVITTTRAYNDLELEGFIQTVPGKGCYVKKIDNDLIRMQYLAETRSTLATAVKQAKMAGLDMAGLHKLLAEMGEDGI